MKTRIQNVIGALAAVAILVASMHPVSAVAAPVTVGAVSEVKLIAYGTPPEGDRAPKFHNDSVVLYESLETVEDGALTANLIDETVLNIGGNARLTIDEMVFDPATHKGRSLIKLAEGTFHFVSGLMEKPNVRIETPSATIGIRGTEFTVHVDKTGATSVNVISGMVQLASKRTRRTALIPGGSNAAATETGDLTPVREGLVKTGDKFIDGVAEKAAKVQAEKIQKAEKDDRESNGLAKAVGLSDEDLKENNGLAKAVGLTDDKENKGLAKAVGLTDDKENKGLAKAVGLTDDKENKGLAKAVGQTDDNGNNAANGLALGNGNTGNSANAAAKQLTNAAANGLANGLAKSAEKTTGKPLNLLPGKLKVIETPKPTQSTGAPVKTYRLNKQMKVVLANVTAPDVPVVAESSNSRYLNATKGEITDVLGSEESGKGASEGGNRTTSSGAASSGAANDKGASGKTAATTDTGGGSSKKAVSTPSVSASTSSGATPSGGGSAKPSGGGATKPAQTASKPASAPAVSTPKPVVQTVTTVVPKAPASVAKPVTTPAPKPVAKVVKPVVAAVKPTVPKAPAASNNGKSNAGKKK